MFGQPGKEVFPFWLNMFGTSDSVRLLLVEACWLVLLDKPLDPGGVAEGSGTYLLREYESHTW